MNKKWYMIAVGAIIFLFVIILLLGCVSVTDKPGRICEKYIVGKGETLWEISEKYARGDKRAWIYEICEINGIKGSGIYAGQAIYVYREE